MKKLIYTLILMISFSGISFAASYDVNFNETKQGTYELKFSLEDFQISEVTHDGITYSTIEIDHSVFTKKKGYAELPYLNASIKLSASKNVDLDIVGGDFEEIDLDFPLLPSKGVIYRDQDPSQIPYEIDPASIQDKWYPAELARATSPFIIKDIRGTTVYTYPFRYNAATNTLRVYSEMTIQLVENNTTPINPLVESNKRILREMDAIYQSLFINYNPSKDDLTIDEYGDILVITTSRDEAAIQPYIDWKMEKGYNVTKEVVATGTNVKSLIQQQYDNNNDLLYVQLVGDWEDVKSDAMGSAPTDPQLGCVAGSDDQPDITIGRFVANSPAHVTTQVNKLINYEKNPMMGENWYSSATGVASNQGPGDDNEYDNAHNDVIYNDKLDPFTYDNFNAIYDPQANPSMVANAVNSGTSIINYTGHGSSTSWGSSGFSNSDISQLTNGDKLPFIFSVACVNGVFHEPGTCFAEAWMQKDNGGAIMTLMATINQPWDPPMRGQDYFNDIIIGGYDYSAHPGQSGISTTEQRSTLGAAVFNGLVLMTTESGGNSDWETAKTWIYFGDPSMQMRTATPSDLTLSNDVILTGVPFTTTITDNNGPVEGAMLCLSKGGEYYSAISDATGEVVLDHALTPGTAKLVVTAFNTETIYQDATIVPPGGAWVILDDYVVDDAAGNNNGMADYGESVMLDVSAENVGSDDANNVTATLSTADQYVSITGNTHNFGNIPAGSVIQGDDAFALDIAGDVPDNHMASFTADFTSAKDSWTSNFSINLHAPMMEYVDYTISDATGNGNGKIDPGETVDIAVTLGNEGSADAYDVYGEMICADPYITINTNDISYGDIASGASEQGIFSVSADINTPQGHTVVFNIEITAQLGVSGSGSFNTVVGQIPVLIIDMDANNNSAVEMQTCMQNLGITAEMMSSFPNDLNLYSSVFVCLGIYSDNHVLSDSEGQLLADYLNNGGSLYMEGGDTWYFDDQTPVHSMFNINATGDGSSDLSSLNGQSSTFTDGMSFSYSGDNNWIDHIDPIGSAFMIFENQSPSYGSGIAYDEGTYKTIGCSHEFGGLSDGASPSTKDELMEQYLDFFGVLSTDLVAYFTADITEMCEEETVLFTDYSLGAVTSWSWEFPGGDPATSTEQNPSVTYNTAGVYDVTLTISDGTDSHTFIREDYIEVFDCTGLSENDLTDNVSVFPNPGNGDFELNIISSEAVKADIKVVNLLNETVFSKTGVVVDGTYEASMDLTELPNGLYLLVVDSDGERTVKRIVISK